MFRYFFILLSKILPPSRLFLLRRWILIAAGVDLSHGVSFCGGGHIYGRGRLYIGTGTWLSPATVFYTHDQAPIKIGRNCDIGPGVEFIPGGHEIGSFDRRAGNGTAREIIVCDGCWIGAKSVILGGVRIGTGSVVAAGSVVTRDVPDNVLVAGVPARIKRELGV